MKRSLIAGIACAGLIAASAATADTTRNPVISAKRVAHAAGETSSGLNATEVAIMLTGIAILAIIINTNGGSGMMSYPITLDVSDERLKTDITRIGTSARGIPIYSFRYGDAPDVYTGVMAQDVMELAPEAVVPLKNGYFGVDYGKIDVDFALAK